MELLWTPEAIRDREVIYSHIESDSPSAAVGLDNLISEKTAMLRDHPRMGRSGRVVGTYELIVHNSYMVVYEIHHSQIRILAVVHTARQWPQN